MSTKPIKPYVLRKEDAERDIFNAVNDSAKTIPWCTVEDILTNILHQVRAQAEKERAIAKQSYDKELAEFNKAEEEAEEEAANEVAE